MYSSWMLISICHVLLCFADCQPLNTVKLTLNRYLCLPKLLRQIWNRNRYEKSIKICLFKDGMIVWIIFCLLLDKFYFDTSSMNLLQKLVNFTIRLDHYHHSFSSANELYSLFSFHKNIVIFFSESPIASDLRWGNLSFDYIILFKRDSYVSLFIKQSVAEFFSSFLL